MTIAVDRSPCPTVFDAGLPSIDYEDANSPDEAHEIIRKARLQAPIALGPHGPELLTYNLVHSVLRDPRFQVPQGMFLAAQGITSGPIWDRVATNLICLDGDEHHRQRLDLQVVAPGEAGKDPGHVHPGPGQPRRHRRRVHRHPIRRGTRRPQRHPWRSVTWR